MTSPADPRGTVATPPAPDLVGRRNIFLNLFFGRDSSIERAHLRILRLVALGIVFENYDIGLVNSALPQIAPDLGISEAQTGYYTGAVRLGGLASLLLIPLADIIGRRRVFLLALIGMSLGTFLTAFVQTPWQFVAVQVVTRAFMLTGATVAVVILVEEFPASQRGSAIGLLSMLGGLGYGLGALFYAFVEDLPFGWRALYAAGAAPLLLMPFFRRSLAETRRFERHSAERGARVVTGLRDWLAPFVDLVRSHPRRAIVVGAAGLFASMASIAFFQYTSYFVQKMHGWSPGHYTLLLFGAGALGVFGNVLGGRGSDRLGRRGVGFVCLALAPLFAFAFFQGPEAALVPAWGLFVLCMSAGDVIVRAFAAELFPTGQRGTSSGILIGVQAIGFGSGLLLVGLGTNWTGDLGRMVSWVAVTAVVAAFALLLLPETHQQELEEISPGR